MKLIINADDYGCTVPVSLGILEGMKYGLITSTSAIVPCPYFNEMAIYAQEHGLKRMGLHSMLTMVRPTLTPSKVPTLVDENGDFFDRKGFMEKEVNINEARAELENQIRLFLETGLELDHIDTHHGFLMKNDEFFYMFLDLAEKYNVPLRNEISRMESAKALPYQNEIRSRGIKVVDRVYFNHGTPYHTVPDIINFLEEAAIRYPVIEIGCHPGHSDAYLRSISVLNDDREKELEVMTSPELRQYISEHDIQLINYDQL
ncbi:carbohydrate deacetylase [Streptococcus merionis]|uniref:carbohydrate deacetylase n=1 Tax=Streptococcus merionis TaxID=400065 RepID=UPI0026F34261|nr:ChbG/HpnK family deacetylase [Streptococcus merionis]